MKRYLPFVIVVVVGLLTLASGMILYRTKRVPVLTISKDQVVSETDNTMHARGNAKAPVTLEEFGDFECPPCGQLAGPIKEMERDFGERLRVIFRHLPLITHAYAREAAFAAEAAGLQGRFWEMHDLLYKEQAVWSKADDVRGLFNAYAGMLGLKLDRFKKDMESEQVKVRVASDQERATSLGVTTTPTIFLNDRAVPAPSLHPAGLRAAIDAAIKAKPGSDIHVERKP